MKKINKIIIICIALLLSACAKQVQYHGFNFEHASFDIIKVGKTSKNQVIHELGSPTSESNFGEKKFYYISRKVEKIAFLEPTVIEQKVLVIGFDKKHIVKDITELALDNANKIVFSENLTEIQGNTLTILQQFLTNIGKFKVKK